ncbi:MAG: hypothetical protein COT17_05880 [Elusimicrobia bacterium CG08_land_8_20_14_0_20_51_18]|nr:MAG: hypothetical protein COT17_05880 [Elusimicrobia bacterium CG08_land_8_20_14_0_20_51_18]
MNARPECPLTAVKRVAGLFKERRIPGRPAGGRIKKILFAAMFLSVSAGLFAFGDGKFSAAAELYKNGDFGGALKTYEEILSRDGNDPYALYNAGNCLYKNGDQTGALIYYLKSFKLLPRNQNIRYNLEFTAKQTGQTLFSSDIPQVFYYVYYFFSDAELTALYTLFLWIFFLALAFFFWEKHREKAGAAILFSLLLAGLFFSWSALRKNSFCYSAGVISAREARILSGPGDNFKVSATVTRAKIVRIMDDSDENFFEAGLIGEGLKGWISKQEITKI